PPGLGKTTLASIIASEMGVDLKMTSGPVLEKAADLAGVLSNLNEGSVLFIDEIHRLKMNVEEYLYPAMEDFKLDLMVDTGASARSLQINLNRFTLIAATTRQGSLSRPLRSRFTTNFRMDFYEDHVLAFIIKRSANMLGFELSSTAAEAIAKRSRGTPRVANNLLKWVRDYVDAQGLVSANESVALTALGMLDIDEIGLDEMDRRLLKILIEQYDGGPVGINTLALTLGEEPSTIEEVHEPFLILKGLLNRTPRGRVVSPLAYKHLNMNNNTNNETSPS
ncbi:Holliday junction branch migration DNA helicase RuvB, partial [Chlamydiia bacterium]|nr:Holliday junction branch migration DNA helicase RuvB [Chlamydiia bacterium]